MHKLVIALLCLPLAAPASTVVIASATATCTIGAVVKQGAGCSLTYTVFDPQVVPGPVTVVQVDDYAQGVGASGNRLSSLIGVFMASHFQNVPIPAYSVTAENTASFFAPVDLMVDYTLDLNYRYYGGHLTLTVGGKTASLDGNCIPLHVVHDACEVSGTFFAAAGTRISFDALHSYAMLSGQQPDDLGNGSSSDIQLAFRAADGVTLIDLVLSPEPSTLFLILTAFGIFSASRRAISR